MTTAATAEMVVCAECSPDSLRCARMVALSRARANAIASARRTLSTSLFASSDGLNFMREIAEQNINQSKMLLHSLLTITKKVVDDIDQQSSDLRHRSM